MVSHFTGTLPIRPYHPTQFFGTIKADGQLPRVAALACHHQEVVAISLVGYDTSVSAALARLWQREQLAFEPDPSIDWHGPGQPWSQAGELQTVSCDIARHERGACPGATHLGKHCRGHAPSPRYTETEARARVVLTAYPGGAGRSLALRLRQLG